MLYLLLFSLLWLSPSHQASGAVKKLGGRAFWRAIAPANPCPMRLGGSLALPISADFEFFQSSRSQPELPVDFSAYRETADFRVTRKREALTINWYGENRISFRLSLNLADPEKLIAELSQAVSSAAPRKIILKDAAPAYRVTTGKRNGGWDNFFDSPARLADRTRSTSISVNW